MNEQRYRGKGQSFDRLEGDKVRQIKQRVQEEKARTDLPEKGANGVAARVARELNVSHGATAYHGDLYQKPKKDEPVKPGHFDVDAYLNDQLFISYTNTYAEEKTKKAGRTRPTAERD